MKKKLLALVLAAAMLVAVLATGASAITGKKTSAAQTDALGKEYPEFSELYVAGVPVTEGNCKNILKDVAEVQDMYPSEGYAAYDFNTNTLTLRNVYINYLYVACDESRNLGTSELVNLKEDEYHHPLGAIESRLGSNETLTIKLIGENVIEADNWALLSTGNVVFDFAENATLTMYGSVWAYNEVVWEKVARDFFTFGDEGGLFDQLLDQAGKKAWDEFDKIWSIAFTLGMREEICSFWAYYYLYVTYFLPNHSHFDFEDLSIEQIKIETVQFFLADLVQKEWEKVTDANDLLGDLYGDITVKNGTLTILSTPDFYAMPVYEVFKEFVEEEYTGLPFFRATDFLNVEQDDYLSSPIAFFLNNFPVSSVVAENFNVQNGKVTVDVYDEFSSRHDETHKLFGRYDYTIDKVGDFFYGGTDFLGDIPYYFVDEKELQIPVKSVNLMGKLSINNSLFYVARNNTTVDGNVSNARSFYEAAEDTLYVRGGVESKGGYIMKGSEDLAEYSVRYEAQEAGYFSDMTVRDGHFFVEDTRKKAFTATRPGTPDTVWIESKSFCFTTKVYADIANNGLYYAGYDGVFTPTREGDFLGNSSLYFEKNEDGTWKVFKGCNYISYGQSKSGDDYYKIDDGVYYENTAMLLGEYLCVFWNEKDEEFQIGHTYDLDEVARGKYYSDRAGGEMEAWYDWTWKNGTLSISLVYNLPHTVYLKCVENNDVYYATQWAATRTPTRLNLYREIQNPKGHSFKYSFTTPYNGFHTKVCQFCGLTVTEPCNFDPNDHRCECGRIDPNYISITPEDVQVWIQKIPLLFGSFYDTFEIGVRSKLPVKTEYRVNNDKYWSTYGLLPGSGGLNVKVTKIHIRVSDTNGNQYYFLWEAGKGVSEEK